MKKIFILTLFLAILFTTFQSYADPQVPQLINLQMILADEGGNKLPDDIQQKDVTLQLVDGGGNVDFEEQQTIPVVRSAISVMVGQATDGGIPYEAFAPGESKILRVKLNDQSIPQEDLLIASVPYSMYAGYATNLTDPLDAAEVILNGSIDIEHLSEALLAYIDNAMIGISAQDLENHKTEQEAHPASSINVENNFTNLTGTDLQTILEAVDNALNIKEQQDEVIDEIIQAVEAELQAAITAAVAVEAGIRAGEDTNLWIAINQEILDRQALQAELDAHEALTTEVHGVTGNVVGTSDEQTLTNKTLTETIYQGHQEMDDEACQTAYGDINGDDTVDDNDGCLVDGVDISQLKDAVDGALDDYLRLDGTTAMAGDLNMGSHGIGSVTNISASGTITATYFSGDGASITSLSGSNINSGTVDDSYIDSAMATDSELTNHTDDTSAHGVSGNIVGTSDTQTLSYKTLDSTNAITGNAITSGTVSISYIDSEVATDTDLSTHASATYSIHGLDSNSNVVGTNAIQTLTNKTLGSGTTASSDVGVSESCSATAGDGIFTDDSNCVSFDGVDPSELEDRVGNVENTITEIQGQNPVFATVVTSGSWTPSSCGIGTTEAVDLETVSAAWNEEGAVGPTSYFAVVQSSKGIDAVGSSITVKWYPRIQYVNGTNIYRYQMVFELSGALTNCSEHTINYTIYQMDIN